MTEQVDPDLSPAPRPRQGTIVAVVAIGGAIGALARYAAGLVFPCPAGQFPLTTLVINVLGAALIGVLMVLVTERHTVAYWVRPLLGTGILGGFTTFSTAMTDAVSLAQQGHPLLALAYTVGTVVAAVFGVLAAVTVTRAVTR